MKNLLLSLLLACPLSLYAQNDHSTFRASLYNEEYDLNVDIDFSEEGGIVVPSLESFGPLPGYLHNKSTSFWWVILEAELKDDNTAELTIVNESGSEDLTATLICNNDSIYTLKQRNGSTLKVVNGRKWQKIPSTLTLKRKK